MVRATRAQLEYVSWIVSEGGPEVDKYLLTISSANAYIARNKIITDYSVSEGLRPEDFNIPNH